VHKTNRFNRKKLHVAPRTVGITADCTVRYTYRTVQGVLIAGLSDRVSYSDYATGCKIRVLDPSRDMQFLSSLKCTDRLIQMVWGFFPGVNWPEHGADHSPPFSGQGYE